MVVSLTMMENVGSGSTSPDFFLTSFHICPGVLESVPPCILTYPSFPISPKLWSEPRPRHAHIRHTRHTHTHVTHTHLAIYMYVYICIFVYVYVHMYIVYYVYVLCIYNFFKNYDIHNVLGTIFFFLNTGLKCCLQ